MIWEAPSVQTFVDATDLNLRANLISDAWPKISFLGDSIDPSIKSALSIRHGLENLEPNFLPQSDKEGKHTSTRTN
jgi:hypothetical protein